MKHKLWAKLSKLGDCDASFKLAEYLYYKNANKFKNEILSLLRRAVEAESAEACCFMAAMYSDKIYLGEEDLRLSLKLYEKAAGLGCVEAMNNLADIYFTGKGVKRNTKKSFNYFAKAARLGDPLAQYNLGMCYYNGDITNRDIRKAKKWLTISALRGNRSAKSQIRKMG